MRKRQLVALLPDVLWLLVLCALLRGAVGWFVVYDCGISYFLNAFKFPIAVAASIFQF